MRYFTSDHHFFDEGIIGYCGRPFHSAAEMNRAMIDNFKNKVREGDEVYMLGDMLGVNGKDIGQEKLSSILEELGIRKLPFHLIVGNHDTLPHEKYLEMGFVWVKRIDFIHIDERKVMLTHDPCMVQQVNTLALCGHIHTLFDHINNEFRNTLTVNVAVERWAYSPISETEIVKIINDTGWGLK